MLYLKGIILRSVSSYNKLVWSFSSAKLKTHWVIINVCNVGTSAQRRAQFHLPPVSPQTQTGAPTSPSSPDISESFKATSRTQVQETLLSHKSLFSVILSWLDLSVILSLLDLQWMASISPPRRLSDTSPQPMAAFSYPRALCHRHHRPLLLARINIHK